jgi:hypothetical protein
MAKMIGRSELHLKSIRVSLAKNRVRPHICLCAHQAKRGKIVHPVQ